MRRYGPQEWSTPATSRRAHRSRRRYAAYLAADIVVGSLRGRGTVLSVSEAGLFTTADLPLGSGALVTISFQLPDLENVGVQGEVIYEATHLDHEGLGVRFLPTTANRAGVDAIRHVYQAS